MVETFPGGRSGGLFLTCKFTQHDLWQGSEMFYQYKKMAAIAPQHTNGKQSAPFPTQTMACCKPHLITICQGIGNGNLISNASKDIVTLSSTLHALGSFPLVIKQCKYLHVPWTYRADHTRLWLVMKPRKPKQCASIRAQSLPNKIYYYISPGTSGEVPQN